VENQLTAPEAKSPEQIQGEMAQTRDSLTEKVAALENQVMGTAQTAANTLSNTVDAVKSLVETAPEAMKQAATAVTQTVKDACDISGHVRSYPWASVGVSTGVGFLTGLLVFRGHANGAAASTPAPVMPVASPPSSSTPGIFDELFAMIGRKVREVAENVIDTATAAVNENVRQGVPKLVDAATEMAADRLAPGAGDHG
jgi:ElaB/YqjD/DUF883 family membrane-anchored ribosome-binding protein